MHYNQTIVDGNDFWTRTCPSRIQKTPEFSPSYLALRILLFFLIALIVKEQSLSLGHDVSKLGEKRNTPSTSSFVASLQRQEPSEEEEWYHYDGVDADIVEGSALDVSFMLEPPAGRHGYVTVKEDSFFFEDGNEARFWGINVVSEHAFPTHEKARYIAKRLAQMGVNLVRFHQLDNYKNGRLSIFGRVPTTTRVVDPDALDRFEYFWAQLKKKGIYLYLDITTSRRVLPDDLSGFLSNTSFHIQGAFINELIDLQKEYAKQILTHTNPYTKTQLCSDPCLALVLIQNEDSLFYLNKGAAFTIDKEAQSCLDELFGNWLFKKYKSDFVLQKHWSSIDGNSVDLQGSGVTKKVKIELPEEWRRKLFVTKRLVDTYEFLYRTQLDYYREMHGYLRKLGVRVPIAGSNHWVSVVADLRANAEMDFVDRHKYWAHPRGGYGIEGTNFDTTPMIKDRKGGIIQNLAARRVLGRPYVVSEWNVGMGNEYQADAQLLMAAFASFQGWHAIHFETGSVEKEARPLRYAFGVHSHPVQIALWPVSALMYHRGDIESTIRTSGVIIDDSRVFDPSFENPALKDSQSFMEAKTGIVFSQLQTDESKDERKNIGYFGQSQLFRWDRRKGVFRIDTSNTQGATGLIGGKYYSFKDIDVKIINPYAALVVTTMTDDPIESSSHLLVTAVSRARNFKFCTKLPSITRSVDKTCVLIEPVEGIVTLKQASSVKVYALSASGKRGQIIPTMTKNGAVSFSLEGKYRTMHYECIVNRKGDRNIYSHKSVNL